MDPFYTFIYEIERKKKEELESMPLYIELGPPSEKDEQEQEKEEKRVIIIEIL